MSPKYNNTTNVLFDFLGRQNVCCSGGNFFDLLVALSLLFRIRVPQQRHRSQNVCARSVPEFLLVSNVKFDGESDNLLLDES